jgi:hypothetical protein
VLDFKGTNSLFSLRVSALFSALPLFKLAMDMPVNQNKRLTTLLRRFLCKSASAVAL